jgi:4-hydroxy-3-polyprenylbenzoate decarboxylase
MDVLDHSCSKLGFGGKMCIDGTTKFEEERDESYEYGAQRYELQLDQLLIDRFDEIKLVNSRLLEKQIPCIILSVEKSRRGHVQELHQQICSLREVEGVKVILYVEHSVNANDLAVSLWRLCNNLDPKRDHFLVQRPSLFQHDHVFSCIGFDGTRKTKELDNFHRDWPNIIVADEATIKSVDEKWDQLGLGDFIPSPSLKYKDQLYGEEAVVQ